MSKFDSSFREEMRKKLDVELLGIASVERSGSRELEKRAAALLPGAKAVVVLGKEIFREVVALLGPTKEAGQGEPGEFFTAHCDYLNGRLTKAVYDLAAILRKEGYRSFPLPAAGGPIDQRFLAAPFSFKHAAELAGLGTIGRHTMLITPEFGPRQRLACLLTEAPLEPSPMSRKNDCVDCDACIRACPSRALKVPEGERPYSINAFACRSYRGAGLTCNMCMKACDEVLG